MQQVCSAHGHCEAVPFNIRADGRYELFQKAVWDKEKKAEQLCSMSAKFDAAEAPQVAKQMMAECYSWAYLLDEQEYKYIAFNWHTSNKGKRSRNCNLQVVCKKCGMATAAVYPFQWDHGSEEWDLSADVFFAGFVKDILEPLRRPGPQPRQPPPAPQIAATPPPLQPSPYRCHFADLQRQTHDEAMCARVAHVEAILQLGREAGTDAALRTELLMYFEEEIEPWLLQQLPPSTVGRYWTSPDGDYCWTSPNGRWHYFLDRDGEWREW